MKNKTKHLTPALTASASEVGVESRNVPYALLRPDPNQPRKTFNEESLKELADSLREQGLLQPLIVELIKPKYKIHPPDLTSKKYRVTYSDEPDNEWEFENEAKARNFVLGDEKLVEHYRIVSGERRWRAAGLAGLNELPVIVRHSLTEQQRFAIQFIENNQRENISALEEAEALKAQLASRRAVAPDFSPEDLAKELGQSRATVYERLKLTRLHKPVREALLAGKISVSLAGEVAKLPTPAAQEKLLKLVTDEKQWNYPYSVRDVQELIDEEYVKQLADAPFDLKLTYGNSVDGILDPCTGCPQRTGNMLAEFPELKSRPNVCTRPDCFAQKCKAFFLAKAENLKGKGQAVLTSREFSKVRTEYLSAEDPTRYSLFDNEYDSAAKVLGRHAPEPVLVATADGLKKYFKRTDIPAAASAAKVKLRSTAQEKLASPEEKAKEKQKEEAAEKLRLTREALWTGLVPTLAKAIPKIKDAAAWKIVELLLDGYSDWASGEIHKVLTKGAKGKDWVLATLFAEQDNAPLSNEWNEKPLLAWKLAGIDLLAEEKKGAPVLPLAKAEPKQGKLLEVKKNKIKTKGKK